ncbi:efflux RND transporter periplasmic adaptor subunit [Sandaracinobacter neustonicus]|uniref:Efflux RND transporter periplasmic adaptor subunit n=1 Tax=Sandaracinobacter neustonicus TaxID=1715348 RepID=A0A501XD34_9SPHN|nr:efflux RND transporter periplasmic adaptor subunit [Sandaracinobacter neustonicus]TPE58495.1 efflux RND transporter periplasmic adaptor subunit [Sandaracinobacter neustonicus]
MRAHLLLTAPLALALSACGSGEPAAVPPQAVVTGERFTLRPQQLPDLAEVPATVTTRDMAEARARIPGVLTALNVHAGSRVSAGQPIALITDSRLTQEAAAQGAGAAAAEAQAARAKADLDRIRFLHREGVYAQAKLDEAQAASRAANAMLAAARAQQGAVKAVEGQGVVRAPAAGTVLVADVPEGSAVAPGMLIATITAGPPIVRLDVPEGLAARLRAGAEVHVSGLAGQAAGETAIGRIVRIYPGVSDGRTRADVTVSGLSPELVGQRVAAAVEAGAREGLAVPARFVEQRFGLRFVRLLSADGKRAADVPVEVRPLADGRVEILSGLHGGDMILAPHAGAGK